MATNTPPPTRIGPTPTASVPPPTKVGPTAPISAAPPSIYPVPPATNAVVGDSIYNKYKLLEDRKMSRARMELGTFDPSTGKWTDGQQAIDLGISYGYGENADMLNPFNRLAQLNRMQGISRGNQLNSAAESGNRASGGYQARRANLLWEQKAQQRGLSDEYLGGLKSIRNAGLDAQDNYDMTNIGLWDDALARKLQADLNDPGAPEVPKAADPKAPVSPWAKAEKMYSSGTWLDEPSQSTRRYRDKNGVVWVVQPSGRRDKVKINAKA